MPVNELKHRGTSLTTLATFFFVGYLPVMPGTWGTLAGVGIYFLVRGNTCLFAAVLAALFFLGFCVTGRAEKIFGAKDDKRIVIDEVCGILLLYFFIPQSYFYLISGFILFRAIDILKPYPIKGLQKLPGSLGIMLDDVLAAAYSFAVIALAAKFFLPRMEFFLPLNVINSEGQEKPRGAAGENTQDKDLAQRARQGDKEAFAGLYRKYKKPIFNYIYRMIGNRSAAEELAQEAFVKAYLNLRLYREQNTFSAWLYKIAGNLAKNELRSMSYRRHASLDEPLAPGEDSLRIMDVVADKSPGPDDTAVSNEFNEAIQKALNSLQAEHREVLTLCDIQHMSYEEAAEVMNIRVGTVASRLSRARSEFNKRISAEYGLNRGHK